MRRDPRNELQRRYNRALLRKLTPMWTPPPAEQWAKFGTSTVRHPSRIVDPSYIEIGDNVAIDEGAFLSVVAPWPDVVPRLVIEDGVYIGRGVVIAVAKEVVIERDAVVEDWAVLADTYHPYECAD